MTNIPKSRVRGIGGAGDRNYGCLRADVRPDLSFPGQEAEFRVKVLVSSGLGRRTRDRDSEADLVGGVVGENRRAVWSCEIGGEKH